jgi:RNA polymerase sigma-70 factor, ECF subfamily
VNETEFRKAFDGHKNAVYRFAFRMMQSEQDAEDIAQETFLALWRRPHAYDSNRGELRAYLLGVTRNIVLKRWRQRRPTEDLDIESLRCAPIDLVDRERQEAIAAAVGQLPVLQREALVLAEYEDLSLEQIARVTCADLAAVKSRLHRARQNLRQMLAGLLSDHKDIQPKGVLK